VTLAEGTLCTMQALAHSWIRPHRGHICRDFLDFCLSRISSHF